MTLQEQIKKDLTTAIKQKDENKKLVLRVLLGEISRYKTKYITDDMTVKTIKKILKDEQEINKVVADKITTYSDVLFDYLPKEVDMEEVKQWISENIDFTPLKTKMQAMGQVMKHFGSSVDGNRVKQILMEIE